MYPYIPPINCLPKRRASASEAQLWELPPPLPRWRVEASVAKTSLLVVSKDYRGREKAEETTLRFRILGLGCLSGTGEMEEKWKLQSYVSVIGLAGTTRKEKRIDEFQSGVGHGEWGKLNIYIYIYIWLQGPVANGELDLHTNSSIRVPIGHPFIPYSSKNKNAYLVQGLEMSGFKVWVWKKGGLD